MAQAPRASPEVSETDVSTHQCYSHRASIHRRASTSNGNGDSNPVTSPEVNDPINTITIPIYCLSDQYINNIYYIYY